jgi:hypothetical protein
MCAATQLGLPFFCKSKTFRGVGDAPYQDDGGPRQVAAS